MKAADVIKAYKNGERNFQRLNLRGANFKEQDLSGADFSYCQLQSANFSQANLTNTKFIGVKAGLQKRWLILFLLVVLVLIIISSLFSALLGSIVSLIFESNLENKVSGWTGLITIIIFFIISFRKNLGGGVKFLAVAFAVAGAFAFAVALTLFACYLGYRTLKDEMRDPWLRKIVIAFAAMGGTSFYKATVTDADFTGATLKNVNFNRAILTRTCFKDTVKLNLARPGNTLLEKPIVRDLLINPSSGEEKDLSKANLRGAYLKEANLQRANLKNADISGATFEYANLSSANLTEVNAVYTNFNSAYLTGACLENWNIDTTTKLDNVDCQYVYLLNNEKERQPSSGDFKTGEFTKLFEEVFDTVNLIFENGIDWKAFIETMKTVQVENEDTPLEVSSIENKGDGVFVVKVKVPPDADKEKIHQEFEENYQLKLQAVEAKYKALLDAKENEISSYHRENANMMEITKILASRPINIETKAMNNSPDNSTNITTGDINNTGNLNIGKIIKDVNNTIDNISESDNNENEQLKTSLKELMQAIETENELDDEEKAGAANNVKTIAKASQKPEDEGLQKKATRAVKLLETLAKGLKPANKLYTACQSILPQIVTFLGITL